jgi:hypothetical protein
VTAEPLPAQWSAVAGVGIVEPPNPARPRRDRRPVVSEIEQTPLDPDRPPHTAFDPRGQPAASGATGAARWVASVAAPTPERDRDSDGRWADGNVAPRSENARRPAEAARRDDSRYHPPSRIARERPARQTGGFVVEADTRPASKPATQIAVAEPPGGGVAFTPRPPTPPIDAAAARDVIAAGTVEQTVIAMDPRSRGTSGEWARLDHWRAVAPSLEGARAVSDAKAAVLAEPERHAMIVGNSITGFTRGALWTEYYAPDGTIKGIWGSTKYVARWSVSGELMCFDYPGSRNYCLMYDVDGDQALFFQQDGNGASTSFRLLTGNPYDL